MRSHALYRHYTEENPALTPTEIALGVGAVVGIGTLIYFATRPPAPAASSTSTLTPGTVTGAAVVLQAGNQTVNIPAGGITISLPAGAAWVGAAAGSPPSIVFPPPAPSTQGSSETVSLQWSLNGVTNTTNLTLTVGTLPGGVGGLGNVPIPILGTLRPGAIIFPGQGLWAPTRNHVLTLQTDNNLVIYDAAWNAIWASNTRGSGAVRGYMQTDGNFVLYKSTTSMAPSQAVWSTGTYGHPGAWCAMQNDGNFVIYDVNGNALWATGT
jgi:hypothetical protein